MSDQVKNQEQVQEQPKFTDGVRIKVADSKSCVSIYGIINDRMPLNLTIEAYDALAQNWDAVVAFVEANRNNLLSKAERKLEKLQAKHDAKLVKQQETKLNEMSIAIALAKLLKQAG